MPIRTTGATATYLAAREVINVVAANVMADSIRAHSIHDGTDDTALIADVVGAVFIGPMAGAWSYSYLKVGAQFSRYVTSQDASALQRWAADQAIRVGFSSSFFISREPAMWAVSHPDGELPRTEVDQLRDLDRAG